MSRGLIGFLAFLVVLSLLLGLVAYLLGPNVLAFIFHAERRTEPVVIVNLLDFADARARRCVSARNSNGRPRR